NFPLPSRVDIVLDSPFAPQQIFLNHEALDVVGNNPTLERCASQAMISDSWRSVRPISSSPSNRQRLLNSSIEKTAVKPCWSETVQVSNDTVSWRPATDLALRINCSTAGASRTTARMPFFVQFVAKMSAN